MIKHPKIDNPPPRFLTGTTSETRPRPGLPVNGNNHTLVHPISPYINGHVPPVAVPSSRPPTDTPPQPHITFMALLTISIIALNAALYWLFTSQPKQHTATPPLYVSTKTPYRPPHTPHQVMTYLNPRYLGQLAPAAGTSPSQTPPKP